MKGVRIHFGWWVRRERERRGWSLREFGDLSGISEKRAYEIELMDVPRVYPTTLNGIARAFDFDSLEGLHNAWNMTPVAPPEKRAGRDAQAELKSLATRAASAGLTAEEVIAHFGQESVRALLGGAAHADRESNGATVAGVIRGDMVDPRSQAASRSGDTQAKLDAKKKARGDQ